MIARIVGRAHCLPGIVFGNYKLEAQQYSADAGAQTE